MAKKKTKAIRKDSYRSRYEKQRKINEQLLLTISVLQRRLQESQGN